MIEGLVVEVCKARGCWMQLASDKEFQTMKIKVKDGVMVFPMSAKGKTAKMPVMHSTGIKTMPHNHVNISAQLVPVQMRPVAGRSTMCVSAL